MTMRTDQTEMYRFVTAQFVIVAYVSETDEPYDGDDDDGETQRKLYDGTYIMFNTEVTVTHKPTGLVLGVDFLGASVYEYVKDFFDEHRRNAAYTREQRALGYTCGSYFPDLVRGAVGHARKELAKLQLVKVRGV